jgi:hypothetical protein
MNTYDSNVEIIMTPLCDRPPRKAKGVPMASAPAGAPG